MSGLLSYDDIFLTEGCREKHLALIIRDKIRRALANEEKSPGRLHTIPYNKIIRNGMEPSGILTVQALCVPSCQLLDSRFFVRKTWIPDSNRSGKFPGFQNPYSYCKRNFREDISLRGRR